MSHPLPSAQNIPLTPLQQGMYFTWLQDPAAGIDIEQMVCTLPEAIDAPRLRTAWETLTATHDILRTTFTAEAATLHPALPTPWQELDLSPSTSDVQRLTFNGSTFSSFPDSPPDSLPAFLEKDRTTPFDLPTGPLQRLTLIRLAPEDYRLIWTFHHILIDGRAITALLREVFALYDQAPSVLLPSPGPLSNLKSQISNPPPPSFQAHNRWQATLDHTPSAPFWKAHLTGINGPTPLVVDHLERAEIGPIRHIGPLSPISPAPKPIPKHPAQAEADLHLSPSLTTTLRTLATTHGLTLNTFVQAAFALLLGRYASEDRVIFGATRACRHTPVPGSPSTIGLLINTLPLAVALPADQPLIALLQNLRQHWLDLRPHEHTPLSFIRRTAGLSATAAPFNHLLVFENDDYTNTLRATGGPAFAHRSFHLRELTSVPLTLAVHGSASLHFHCAYAPATFDADTIQRLLGHVATLLEQFATLPLTTPLSAFTLTTPAERQLLLHDCQPTDPGLYSSHTLHGLFRKTAAKFPERIAVSAEDATWTYAELDQHSDAIARALIRGGVQPGQFVGICMDRRAPLIAALLGILKAGAAYLPIDLAYPPERLTFMLEDAQAPILLTERPLASKIPQNPATTLFIEDINLDSPQTTESLSQPLPGSPSQISNFKSQIPVPHDPDSLAYIIYTSGSTGLPKGCQITHRNVVRLMLGTDHWYGFNESDVWTLFHSTAFDFSVWELWGALLYGGRLVVVPWLTTRSPDDFFKLLCEERVTVLNQTPSAFRQLIQAEPPARATTPNLPPQCLRYVIFGGEALEMQSLKPWYDRHGDTAPVLVNMYGITETTVHVTYRPLSASDLDSGSVIGIPIPDLQLYILDPQNQQPVPLGIPGEMYVGGAGLATGYLRREALTSERFIPNHLTGQGRLYKTGDLARFLPRSTGVPPVSISSNHPKSNQSPEPNRRDACAPELEIEYLGRIDHQVKIRGFRIEPGEIENILTSHPGIHEAAVLAREDRPGDKRLCAYLVPDPSTFNVQRSTFDVPPSPSSLPPTPDALRALLKTRVPDYMVPAAFVFLEKFPMTPNGKLDRKALPAPTPEGPASTRPFIPPATPAEQALTTIWIQVLRLDRISTSDNFFEIGGDSILSIQVIARAREAGLSLTPRQLFENPTIAALASVATPLTSHISHLTSQILPRGPHHPLPSNSHPALVLRAKSRRLPPLESILPLHLKRHPLPRNPPRCPPRPH
jgi:amino acid adenylation domain-containing protein